MTAWTGQEDDTGSPQAPPPMHQAPNQFLSTAQPHNVSADGAGRPEKCEARCPAILGVHGFLLPESAHRTKKFLRETLSCSIPRPPGPPPDLAL